MCLASLANACSCWERYLPESERLRLEESREYFVGTPIDGGALNKKNENGETITHLKVIDVLSSTYKKNQVVQIMQKPNFCVVRLSKEINYKVVVRLENGMLVGSSCSIERVR